MICGTPILPVIFHDCIEDDDDVSEYNKKEEQLVSSNSKPFIKEIYLTNKIKSHKMFSEYFFYYFYMFQNTEPAFIDEKLSSFCLVSYKKSKHVSLVDYFKNLHTDLFVHRFITYFEHLWEAVDILKSLSIHDGFSFIIDIDGEIPLVSLKKDDQDEFDDDNYEDPHEKLISSFHSILCNVKNSLMDDDSILNEWVLNN
jgi:hypothetical protein